MRISELDSMLSTAIQYRKRWDRKWPSYYSSMKMMYWELTNRANWRVMPEFPAAFLNILKAQGIMTAGNYTVETEPVFSTPLSQMQANLIGKYADIRWRQNKMKWKMAQMIWDQGYSSIALTKTCHDHRSGDRITRVVQPEDFYVSPGTEELDHTNEYHIHRMRIAAGRARRLLGQRIFQQAEGAEGTIDRRNSEDVSDEEYTNILIDRDTGRVDFGSRNGMRVAGEHDEIFFDEYWLNEGPDWRRITRVGDVVLDDLIYGVQRPTFNRWCWQPLPHEFWGVPSIQPFANLNIVKNEWMATMMDWFRSTAYQKLVFSRESDVDFLDLENNPNGMMIVNGPPGQAVMSMQPQTVPGQAFTMLNYLDKFEHDAGFSEVQFGRAGTNVETVGQTQMLLAANQTGVNMTAALFGETAGDWAMLNWELDSAYAIRVEGKAQRMYQLTGASNVKQIFAMVKAMAEKPLISVKFNFVSGLQGNRENKKREAMALKQAQVVDNEYMLDTFDIAEKGSIMERQQKAGMAQALSGALENGVAKTASPSIAKTS